MSFIDCRTSEDRDITQLFRRNYYQGGSGIEKASADISDSPDLKRQQSFGEHYPFDRVFDTLRSEIRRATLVLVENFAKQEFQYEVLLQRAQTPLGSTSQLRLYKSEAPPIV